MIDIAEKFLTWRWSNSHLLYWYYESRL